MLTRFAAVLSLSVYASEPGLLVLHKGDSSLGFYTPDGKLTTKIKLNLHPHEVAFSTDRRYLYITENGTMRIENIAAGGNSVAIVDLKARKKLASVSTEKYRRPHGIDFENGSLFVSTEAPDQVLRIDPKERRIVETIDGVGRIAHMVTVTRDGKRAFASNSGSGSVSFIDLATKQVKTIETGKRPEGSVLSPDERFLYVTNRENAAITVIDTQRAEVAAQIETGKGPVRIAITPDGSTLVYALMHDKAIGFADTRSRKQIGTVPVDGSPISLNLSFDGTRAYAASEAIDTVHVISVPDRKLLRTFKTPQGFAPDPVVELP